MDLCKPERAFPGGRVDARGRKQYRYHPLYRKVRDATKFDSHDSVFGLVLPRIRERVEHDIKLPGLPRNKVLATIVELLEQGTCIRVGNEEYSKQNDSFGSTTMRDEHVESTARPSVSGSEARAGRITISS